MLSKLRNRNISGYGIILLALTVVVLGGCGAEGPAALAVPQTITFTPAPLLVLGGTATVSATVSSGQAVTYSSVTPDVCTVDSSTGLVKALTPGTCTIAAIHPGNLYYVPAPQVTQLLPVLSPQTISFMTAPLLGLGGSAIVAATASSGLPIAYSSTTPTVCSVNGTSGLVTAHAAGICIIAADQPGNDLYLPALQVSQTLPIITNSNQTITFGPVPPLGLGGTATVVATASSGLAVQYSSLTPSICTVDGSSGLVKDFTSGNCIIAADQPGSQFFNPAPQVTQTLRVSPAPVVYAPGTPTGVTATVGNAPNTIIVTVGAVDSGGSPITSFTVQSTPAGITVTGQSSPISLTCQTTCNGFAFSVFATNAVGNGPASAPADVITAYNVIETFYEPDTQPNNSIFIGSFTYNATKGIVSNLKGKLSESMTGGSTGYPNDTMTWLPLKYQLSSVSNPTLGGLLVTTFMLNTTNTLSTQGGGDGWSPGTGFGMYYGFPAPTNPGNAYAMIFVNTANPTVPLTQAQINKLAYADCAPGGMMGATCMTGTTEAGYGTVGTMSGYPVSQVITRQP